MRFMKCMFSWINRQCNWKLPIIYLLCLLPLLLNIEHIKTFSIGGMLFLVSAILFCTWVIYLINCKGYSPGDDPDFKFKATGVWVFLALGIFYVRFDELVCLNLNEIGDMLAGIFAPLAMYWIIETYRQQGKDLSLNREALSLQAEEMTKVAKAQAAIVDLESRSSDPVFVFRSSMVSEGENNGLICPVEVSIKNDIGRIHGIYGLINTRVSFHERVNRAVPNDRAVDTFILTIYPDVDNDPGRSIYRVVGRFWIQYYDLHNRIFNKTYAVHFKDADSTIGMQEIEKTPLLS